MKTLFALVIAFLSSMASAQYICSDIPDLRRTLAELTRECGAGGGGHDQGICHAQVNSSKFPGYTVNEAVDLCIRAGWSDSSCASRVTCEGFRSLCNAQVNSSKYPGMNVNEAISLCVRAGWSDSSCASRVTCEGFRRICYAQVNSSKFPGVTVNEAIATCKRAGWSESSCASRVTCE
jgi:hypothetical protein